MLEPLPQSQWNYRTAAHLSSRAGFGGTPAEIEALVKLGPERAVASFVDFDKTPDPVPAPEWAKPETDEEYEQRQAARRAAVGRERNKLDAEHRSKHAQNLLKLLGWWTQRMAKGPRPLQEKLTLFWHGHFATSYEKMDNAYLMFLQNDTFRKNAAGNWTKMLEEMTVDPAMLIWLDQHTSNKRHPNENYAREVMELFSLGEGNYTEKDVVETARALTGLTLDRTRQKYVYKDDIHDDATKTVLGKTGNLDWKDVLNLIQVQPQSQRFITAKMWRFFTGVKPSPELADALAEELRRSANFFRPVLRRMFLAQEFYTPAIVNGLVKSPVQWLVGTCRMLERDLPPADFMQGTLTRLGQRVFFPPDVNGWEGGDAWITTNTLLDRYNVIEQLIFGDKRRQIAPAPIGRLFTPEQRRDKPALIAALEKRFFLAPLDAAQKQALIDHFASKAQLDDRGLQHAVRLALATPEYQLS